MNMHILYNLRTKHNLEIDELAQQLNEKYGSINMKHIKFGNGRIITMNLNLKMPCI